MIQINRLERYNLPIIILIIGILLFSLWTLIWLARSFEEEVEASVEKVQNIFTSAHLIGTPDDINIRFSEIEGLARSNEDRLIRKILVSKTLSDGDEHLIHPFWYSSVYSDWERRLKGFRKFISRISLSGWAIFILI